MKYLHLKVILFCAIIFCNYFAARAQPGLTFQYDEAGNQIVRQWICINCTPQELNSIPPGVDAAFDKLEDKLPVVRSIDAYPNPVTETLKVEWESNNEIFVRSMQVYSLAGATAFQGEYTSADRSTIIPFLNMERGFYVLRVTYSDGKKQSIKIMKK